MRSTNNKILVIAVALLLTTNIALVVLMLTGRTTNSDRGRRGKSEPFELLVKELNLTEQQQKEFKELKDAHFSKAKPLFDSLRAGKNAFFALVKQENIPDSVLNLYSQRINETQSKLDKMLFAHLKKVRSLCTPEQQPKFDMFVQKMMQKGRRDSVGKNDSKR